MTARQLDIQGAEVWRDGARLLGPVTCALDSSGITAVMGPNGAGKSLFLQMVHGLIAPDVGTVHWDGQPAAETRRSRGFVFQSAPIMRRSVRANIEFPLQATGVHRADRVRKVDAMLHLARLSDRAETPAATLSGGERQRMALARALSTNPTVILLDEPAANLDPASTAELESIVRDIAAQGVKILIATHDIAQARRLAGDVLFFEAGQLAEQANAHTFLTEPTAVSARNYLEGRL